MGKLKKAVITAAGRGTRHFPATRTVQKELFPLVDVDGRTKPVLQIVVEEALAAGAERVCIVCSPDSEREIRSHFAPVEAGLRRSLESKPEGLRQAEHLDRLSAIVEFVVQPAPDGFGDAVLCARDFVGDDAFLLMLGDHVYVPDPGAPRCAASLAAALGRADVPLSGVARTSIEQLHLFGTVAGRPLGGDPPLFEVTEMIEKPSAAAARELLVSPGMAADEFLTFFGMHILPPRVFDFLAERKAHDLRESGEIQLTSSLRDLVSAGPYFAAEVPGRRLDMGVPEGLVETQFILARHSPFRKTVEAR